MAGGWRNSAWKAVVANAKWLIFCIIYRSPIAFAAATAGVKKVCSVYLIFPKRHGLVVADCNAVYVEYYVT
jgi:hypothetical protein